MGRCWDKGFASSELQRFYYEIEWMWEAAFVMSNMLAVPYPSNTMFVIVGSSLFNDFQTVYTLWSRDTSQRCNSDETWYCLRTFECWLLLLCSWEVSLRKHLEKSNIRTLVFAVQCRKRASLSQCLWVEFSLSQTSTDIHFVTSDLPWMRLLDSSVGSSKVCDMYWDFYFSRKKTSESGSETEKLRISTHFPTRVVCPSTKYCDFASLYTALWDIDW